MIETENLILNLIITLLNNTYEICEYTSNKACTLEIRRYWSWLKAKSMTGNVYAKVVENAAPHPGALRRTDMGLRGLPPYRLPCSSKEY